MSFTSYNVNGSSLTNYHPLFQFINFEDYFPKGFSSIAANISIQNYGTNNYDVLATIINYDPPSGYDVLSGMPSRNIIISVKNNNNFGFSIDFNPQNYDLKVNITFIIIYKN